MGTLDGPCSWHWPCPYRHRSSTKKNKTRKGALIGIIVGAVVALAVAIVGNIIVTPFYAHMTTAQVVALIVPALLPFNALKFTIHGVVTFLIYKPISNLLNR